MRTIRWCESRPKEVEGSAEYLAFLHEQLKRFPPTFSENKVDNVDAHRVTAVRERARPSVSSEVGFRQASTQARRRQGFPRCIHYPSPPRVMSRRRYGVTSEGKKFKSLT